MVEPSARDIADVEDMARLSAIDIAQTNHHLLGRLVTVPWARGFISGLAIWLSTTLGPEYAAEVLYGLADEAAARVMTPARMKFLQNRKR